MILVEYVIYLLRIKYYKGGITMVINTKGQIVIPKKIRERFGIHPGQEVEFREDKGKIILVKTGLKEKFKSLAGKYHYEWPQGVKNTRDLLKELRG